MTVFWKTLADLVRRHRRVAVITVVSVEGSTPREPGARMIVTPERAYAGSIGGGALEFSAISIAAQRLESGAKGAVVHRMSLGPELAQCCGGRVALLVETHDVTQLRMIEDFARLETEGRLVTHGRIVEGEPVTRQVADRPVRDGARLEGDGTLIECFSDLRHPVLLFGAGHVGRALALALAPLPVRVTWIDSRADAFPRLTPPNVEARSRARPEEALADAAHGSCVLVMTHSHPLDQRICHAALLHPAIAHVGLIGSATKRARFVSRLRKAGVPPEALERLTCPIGLPEIRGKMPAVIAASIAADLLVRFTSGDVGPTVEIGHDTFGEAGTRSIER
jgi:xanthine dehydrogenase accessory factor